MAERDLFDRSVLIVSGKGGVGKTAVAAACARAATRHRRRVILAEVEGRGGLSGLLGLPPPGFQERRTRFGYSILSVTAKEALLEYLWLFFHMKAVARSLQRAKVVDAATESIPGFRDVMVSGKLYELTAYRAGSGAHHRRPPYDLVVVDAPPTGQLLPFLESAHAYHELIRGGRPNRQLGSIDRLLRHDSRIALVAVPEELSVAETLETIDALREAGMPDPVVLVNQVQPAPFPRGVRAAGLRLDAAAVANTLREAGEQLDTGDAEELMRAVREMDDRVRDERRQIGRLENAARVVELPFLYTPRFGPDEVEALAEFVA
jgi:anion-transporting  ArsA/GET3 family ATPase